MSLVDRIDKDYLVAYKAKDSVKKAVLRHLKTAIKNSMIDSGRELSDDDVLALVAKQIKQRKDSLEQYIAADRPELAERERVEIEALSEYMPLQLSSKELEAAASKAIADLGACSLQDMGKVIQSVMAAHKGQVDGKALSVFVRSCLS